jgi:hypothetical protein
MPKWLELSTILEFDYNNGQTLAIGLSAFNANNGYHPNTCTSELQKDILRLGSKLYGYWMMVIHDDYCEDLEKIRKSIKKYPDRDRAEPAKYSKGDLFILSGKNIRT